MPGFNEKQTFNIELIDKTGGPKTIELLIETKYTTVTGYEIADVSKVSITYDCFNKGLPVKQVTNYLAKRFISNDAIKPVI